MTFKRNPLFFGLLYGILSIGIEAACMMVFRLRPPGDNAILAPIVLVVPPLLASWLAGWRWSGLAILAMLTAALTLVFTIIGGRITGVNTGLALPLVVRGLAGFVAAWLAGKIRTRQ